MASQLSDIGFPVGSQEEFVELAHTIAPECEVIACRRGRYLRWSSHCGAELWLQTDKQGRIFGMDPHFSGEARVRVAITERILRQDATPLDGAFRGWADPETEAPDSGCYPLVFDCPEYLTYESLRTPSVHQVQIAAFAQQLEVYESVEAHDRADGDGLASQAFIPYGDLQTEGGVSKPPAATAAMAGHIKKAGVRTNPYTGKTFHWAKVESFGGVYDVVADPELVTSAFIPGGVISGFFWLSGRIPGFAPDSKRGLLGRLFR